MLKLKLQYFGYLMWRADSLEKTLMLGKIKGGRRGANRWDGWMASLTGWTWVCTSSRSWWWTGKPGVLQSTGLQRVGHNLTTELNWTDSHHNMDKSQDNYAEWKMPGRKKSITLWYHLYDTRKWKNQSLAKKTDSDCLRIKLKGGTDFRKAQENWFSFPLRKRKSIIT